MRSDELSFVVRRSRRISRESSSQCIIRLVPVFIINKLQMFAHVRQKTANKTHAQLYLSLINNCQS